MRVWVSWMRGRGRGDRWGRQNDAPRLCGATLRVRVGAVFDPRATQTSLLEVIRGCSGPPVMCIDVLYRQCVHIRYSDFRQWV